MNYIDRIIKESIDNLILETEMNFDFLYSLHDDDDITKYVMDYINWTEYGKKDPSFSILASKLHDALMYSLALYHENEKDRKTFVKILNYCNSINKTVGIDKIKYEYRKWCIYTKNEDKWNNTIFIDTREFNDEFKTSPYDKLRIAMVYQTYEGYKVLKTIYRPGSDNGSSGDYITSAIMNEDMKQKIYNMHLIPALLVEGSYHENWVYSVGILPQYLTEIKNDEKLKDVIFFDCKF
jgi:hypothetical protein